MSEKKSEKLLTPVEGTDVAHSIKNVPLNGASDQESGDKVKLIIKYNLF